MILVLALVLIAPMIQSANDVENEVTGTPVGWTEDIRLTNDTTQDVGPALVTENGKVHLVWEKNTTGAGGHYDVFYINSTNSGIDWNNSTQLTGGTSGIYCRNPDIGLNDSNIHVIWDDNDAVGREIKYRNSTDGGISWNSPLMISEDEGTTSTGGNIAVNNSTLHVIWIDERFGPSSTEIFYKQSTDGGTSWGDALGNPNLDRRITHDLSGATGGNIAVNGSNIHVLFGDDRDGSFDIYYIRSIDNGITWDDGLGTINEERKLTSNTTDHVSCALAINGSTIHIAWIDEAWPGPTYSIYYRNSTDNGETWNSTQLLSGPSSNVSWAPDIEAWGNDVHVVWNDQRDDGVFSEIYYKKSINRGATWGLDTRLTSPDGNHSGGPKAALDGGIVHVTWYDLRDGDREIYYKRYPEFPLYYITLNQGWNLISLPLEQSDESIETVLNSIAGKWDCIQTYNPLSPEPWQTNNTNRPDQLNDFSTLNHKMGFWINITEPGGTILTISGYDPPSTSINLYAGWNLVGYPSLTNVTVANALWGTSADKVEVFDPAEPYRIKEVGPTYMMKPGEGYWVHVPADTMWIIDW